MKHGVRCVQCQLNTADALLTVFLHITEYFILKNVKENIHFIFKT